MKKTIQLMIAAAFALSPALYAADTQSSPARVGKGAEEGADSAKSSHWGQFAIAAGAIAVGVTAIVLIANNKGHHHHSSSSH